MPKNIQTITNNMTIQIELVFKMVERTSLGVQWLRIHLKMQGIRV